MIPASLLWNKRIRPTAAKSARHRRRLDRPGAGAIEPLESRIAPATFAGTGTALAINLTATNEVITFHTDGTNITATLAGGTAGGPGGTGITGITSGSTSVTITSTDYTTISVTDSMPGESVAFADSGGNQYAQAFTINLSQAGSGNITFTGANTFTASFSGTTNSGFISSDAASSVNISGGSSNLSLTATGHDLLMEGAVTVGGTTSITAGVVDLHNSSNNFTGAIGFTGPAVANVFSSGALTLGASSFAFSSLNQTTTIVAGGAITQSGAITATGTSGFLDFSSIGAPITLITAGNSIATGVALGLSATGTNAVSFTNAGALTLGNIDLGTIKTGGGLFSATAGGNITQKTGTTFDSGGAVDLTLTSATTKSFSITLANAGNEIGGAVTAQTSGSASLKNFSLRNAYESATAPTLTATPTGSITLYFDNTGIALPAYTATTLTVTAGGNITQTGAETVSGATSVSVLGDYSITLTNSANAFSGAVSLSAAQSTHSVAIENSTGLTLGTMTLGRGTFSATAATGNIIQNNEFTEEKGAGIATFAVTAGDSILLLNNGNDFTGPVDLAGAGLTAVNIVNADYQASYSQLSIPSTVSSLSVEFTSAPINLPTLNLANLVVSAQGIVQQSNTSLTVSGGATFDAGAFPITLSNSGNNIASVTLLNSGRNDVALTTTGALNFSGPSSVGSGHLTILAGGNITESDSVAQGGTGPAAGVSFTSTGGSVMLTGTNELFGAVSISVTGANTASITQTGSLGEPLILGKINTGAGSFTASSGSAGIIQDPNSVLTLGGSSSFTTSGNGPITLANQGNTFTGGLSLTGGNSTIFTTGPLSVGGAVTGALNVTSGVVSQSAALTVTGAATFNAGSNDITLTNAGNSFGSISLISAGASLAVTESGSLAVGAMQLGSGTLSLTAGANITTAAGGSIVQAGAGAITLTTPSGNNVTLNNAANDLLGSIDVPDATNVSISSIGPIDFASSSNITGELVAFAGGVLTLPSNLTGLAGLSTSASSTTVSSNITTGSSNIAMSGNIDLNGSLTLTSATNIVFGGNVTVGGALTLNAATGLAIDIDQGVFNLGANALTINGTNVGLQIGTSSGTTPAALDATNTTISIPGNGSVTVEPNGAINVSASVASDVVTLANGSGTLTINGALGVGFGVTNGQLVKTGTGLIKLGATSHLTGTGLAGQSATPVLASQTALITGSFENSFNGSPVDFFAGSDIVTPTYSDASISVQAGGVASSTGTATGFLPDGDAYTVKSSLGTASGLTTVVSPGGDLAIVVRDLAATKSSTLSITTTGGGNDLLMIDGVSIPGTGSVTVTAPNADFSGSFNTAGTLTALTAHDLIGVSAAQPFLLTDGGPATGATSITAHDVELTTIDLADALTSFKAVSVTDSVNITALKFGAIATTGDPNGSTAGAAGLPDPGNFAANLTSTIATSGVVLGSAAVAGALSGIWDLNGSIGKVTTPGADGWTLGTVGAANINNGGMLANVAALTIGALSDVTVNASGTIGAITSSSITGSTLDAGSFGTVKLLANAKLGDVGNVTNSTIDATSSTAAVDLSDLSIAGNLIDSSLILADGSAALIAVGQSVSGSSITAVASSGHGVLKSITAGAWQSTNVDAETIGAISIKGDLSAGLFGSFTSSTVTVQSNIDGIGLATFSTQAGVSSSTFDIQDGNLTAFKVGQQIASTTVDLPDTALGALGTIQAADWASGVNITAKTIGVVAATGLPAANPASSLLIGNISGDDVYAYLNGGSTSAIGSLTAKGNFTGSTVEAQHGIGAMAVGRSVTNSYIIADDSLPGDASVGNITTLTAGAWSGSMLSANTLGTVKITGYLEPENSGVNFQAGDVEGGDFYVHGATPANPTGINSFSVATGLNSSLVTAPFGIKTFSVGGSIDLSQIVTDNATAPASGFIGSFTAGDIETSQIQAGSILTLKTTGSTASSLLGNIVETTIAIDSGVTMKTGLQALGTMTVAGDFTDSLLDAPASVGKIQVIGRVAAFSVETKIDAGYAASSGIGSIIAGAWGQTGISATTDLVTQSIASITLTGNTHRGFVGTSDEGFIDILGSTAGVGLGSFSATGAATDSLFRVSAGNVNTFTVERMDSSALLVGFTFATADDVTASTSSTNWTSTNYKIGAFTTTAPYSSTDVTDSASFVDSDVIAAILGKITLSGVNPATTEAATFGVAFRTSAGATAEGVVKTDGSATALTPGATGQFEYLGLAG